MTIRLGLAATLALATAACGTGRRAPGASAPRLAPTAASPRAALARTAPAPSAPAVPPLSAAEVGARVTALFGTSLTPGADAAPLAGPTWDINVRSYETHARVAHYVARFTGPARGWMGERITRGTRYEPMIRRKLLAAGLPEDLTYLALIESGYSPHAYSRAAAVGIWQLMAGTARDAGLRVDGWVDERRDPVRSTEAAVRFLSWLHGEFGSSYLAAAAYNGGPGRVSRGLTRFAGDIEGSTGDGFFTLAAQDYLPRETKEYVPQLIAAAIVAKDPARYGIEVRSEPAFAYDSARVPALTPLAAVAAASGVRTEEILDLNPHFLRGVVPPGGESTVRVPVGRGPDFAAAFAALDEDARRGVTRVVTRKRQTLADVARTTGRPAALLAAFNPGLAYAKGRRLVPGQTVLVPTAAAAAAARDVPAGPERRAPEVAAAEPAARERAAASARRTTAAPGAARGASRAKRGAAKARAAAASAEGRRDAKRGAPTGQASARKTEREPAAAAPPSRGATGGKPAARKSRRS
jgi:membrane-bound lytic murein transglycosylase D